jgi:hypothetical protein
MFVTALLVLGLQVASAAPIAIDLETSPGSDGLLGTADDVSTPVPCVACRPLGALGYAALGINFTSGTLFAGNLFPNHGPNNHYSSSTVPDATLSVPVYKISLNSYSVWTLTLYALDASGATLATNTFTNLTGTFALSRLEVSSTTPIARFTVRPEGCLPSAPSCDYILNIDDLVFDIQPQASPAVNIPSLNGWTMALLATLVAWMGWRKGGNHWRPRRRR